MANGLSIRLRLDRSGFSLNLDLTLPEQGITVLFGPSGSGKTTILRCVAGLERAVGRVSLGHTIWQDSSSSRWVPTHQRDLGYVFQEASLFEHMNVEGNLAFGIRRTPKTSARPALDRAIALLGIGHLLHRSVQSLSGGERQRVAIARALALEPSVLLLDEPLASLDFHRRQEILPWLEELHRALKIPMLYVSHNLEELTRLGDRVVLLENGTVQAHGPVSAVIADPIFTRVMGEEAGAVSQFFLSRLHLQKTP